MSIRVLCLFTLFACSAASAVVAHKTSSLGKGNSMIAKVIEMLGEENDKIKADLDAEGKAMAEYTEWCDDEMTEKSYAIKAAKTKIEDLTAEITDDTAELASLDEEIKSLGNEIAERQSEIDEANAQRKKEKEEFLKAEEEQVAMVEELESMEVALKQQMNAMTTPPPVGAEGDAPAEAALVQSKASPAATFEAFLQLSHQSSNHDATATKDQAKFQASLKSMKAEDLAKIQKAMAMMVNSVWVDPESKKNLATLNKQGALLQEEPATVEVGADAMAGMQQNSADNLAAFEGLKGKAEEALQRQRDEEVKKQNEHDLNIASLKQAIALAEDKLDDAKKDHARISEDKAKAEDELSETEASKAADEKALEEVTGQCNEAAAAWDNRQKEAKAEMAAINKAKEILASRVTVFLQQPVEGDNLKIQQQISKTRQKLVNHFRTLGNKLHSIAMLNLVSVASQDPMAQVKGLLTDLIAKLEKEAAEAASLHAFCQEEKKKTNAAIEKKTMTIEKLDSRLDKASTKKAELEETIAELSNELAEISKTNAEATKVRTEQNTVFTKTESDFSEAAEAVDDAIDALKEYYGDSALVQTGSKSHDANDQAAAPPSLGGAKRDSAGGIIGILETMGEEFRKTLKEARSTEREQQKSFDTLMQENKVATASKEAEIKASESEIKSLTTSLNDYGADKKMVEKELAAVNEYVEKLKPQCEGRVVPYAERKAKREAEINGLKEALSILEEESPAGAFSFMQKSQGRLRRTSVHF